MRIQLLLATALVMTLMTGAAAASGMPGAATPEVDDIHVHKEISPPEGVKRPRLEARLHKDTLDGFNLELTIADFDLGMPQAAGDARDGILQGHAHLYINGKKVARLYSRFFHIKGEWLNAGINQITITLNSHEHDTWTSDGKPFLVTVFVDLYADPAVRHVFSSSPLRDKR